MAIAKRIKKAVSPKLPGRGRTPKSAPVPEDFGLSGAPLDRGHPFYFGFVAASGAIIALTLLRALASASQVFVLILISLFLAAGLNPAVLFFEKRKIARGRAVALIVFIVLALLALFSWIAIPPIVEQIKSLISNAPQIVADLKHNSLIKSLNDQYGIVDVLQKKVNSSIKDGQLVIGAFGGVIGVGKAVISGAVAGLTILVLTLYFLSALPRVTEVAYRLVPASRRVRVSKLSDAIIFRVGVFVGGQATVAIIAGVFMFIVAEILRIPYATALGVIVLICGLIPLIGHLLGVGIVTMVALTKSPSTAVIAFLLYVIYVQIENYVVMPRIMKRSLSVPGLVTIIAALIGASLLGLVGGILAVPVAAAILLILDEVVFPRADKS